MAIPTSVEAVVHRALGPMVRLKIGDTFSLDLTAQEAGTLARAIKAVRTGASSVPDIYMSPIASDADFSAAVEAEGLAVAGAGLAGPLPWNEVDRVLAGLAELGT